MARPKKRQRGIRGRPWYRKGTNTWYIDHEDKQLAIKGADGNNVKGADNREQAEKCWVLMQAHMMAPEKGDENAVRLVFSMFLNDIQERNPEAYPAYRRSLVGFADSLPDRHFMVKDLTAFHVDGWVKKNPQWKSGSTKATYIAHVMAALNWAAEPHRRLIRANPLRGYKMPRRRTRGEEALVPEETHEVFFDHVPHDFKLILRALRDTGTRPGNVCSVTAAHCDFEHGGWWFSEATAEDDELPHKTYEKTGEGIFVPVSEKLMEVCRELAGQYPRGPLFRTKAGEPWNGDKIAQRFGYYKEKLAKAGVSMPKSYFAYCYRHTRLTEMLEDGVPETTVAAIAGHKGTATLHKNYSHVLAKRKKLSETLREHLKGRDRSPQATGAGAGPSSSG